MSGRQLFSESEKMCLQELIIKYKLNSTATISAGNPSVKKMAWARLVEEFNSIESNSKRTESQLKKCWDNLKTRRKAALALEKRERMKTGGGPYQPRPSTSTRDDTMIDEALDEVTDVELNFAIDSDNIPDQSQESESILSGVVETEGQQQEQSQDQQEIESETPERDAGRRSTSRHTNYSSEHQSFGGKNVRAKVIAEEYTLRKNNYERIRERDEELHQLNIKEKEWLVKAAEELFHKARIEHLSAEELLACNRARKEEAELSLLFKKKQFEN